MATVTSTSRPGTQSSIQSSNSGVIQLDESVCRNRFLTQDYQDQNPPNNGLSPLLFDFKSSESSANQQQSLITEVGGSGTRQLSSTPMEGNFESFNEFPSSSPCVPFAYLKSSSFELNRFNHNSNSTSCHYSDYTPSSKLSPKMVFNYNELSPFSKSAFHRKKLIEEIVETEESYISSLEMLSGIYLESIINNGNNGIPIRLLLQYVNLLITSHTEFLNDLRNLNSITISKFYHYDIDEITKYLISTESPLMAALVADLMNRKAISVYLYQQYYSMIDLVLKLIDSKEDDPVLGVTLTRGFQKFLESSSTEKLDLSLLSLIHKPIQRISKYKLFLTNLLKLTPIEEDEQCHKRMNDCMLQVDYSIKEINRHGLQEKIKTALLFNNLSFKTSLKFPVEYLGLPMLMGSLNIVYIFSTELIPKSNIFGAFLFKTHLILAEVSTNTNRFDVVFLIPLSVSKVITDAKNNGGMFTQFEDSFKILFEHQFKIYELLVLNFNSYENSIWKEKLEILINHVNGPYELDYSSSIFNEEQGTTSSTIIPSSMQSYDISLNDVLKTTRRSRYNSDNDVFDQCYFQKVIPISVEFDNDQCSHHSYSSKRLRHADLYRIYLRQADRTKIEYILEDLWSEELVSASSLLSRKKQSDLKKTSTSSDIQKRFRHKDQSKQKISLIRKTSIVFGEALKSIFNSTD